MNTKLLILGIILLIITGAFVLGKDLIYDYLGVPSLGELQSALQSDNFAVQQEAVNIMRLAKFMDVFPFILLGISGMILLTGIFIPRKKDQPSA